jgi:hypothetical protein
MPKLQVIATNFTAGVWSPKLRGRVDLEKYNSSLRDGENIVVLKHGGITARPALDYLGPIHDESAQARLVPFIYANDDAYVIEFGPSQIRFWKDGALVESSPGVPYTVTNPYTAAQNREFDYVHSGDTLIMVHPDVPMKRLRRFADASWVFDAAPLAPGPIGEVGARANIQMTLSAVTVGSRTLTAASNFFREADVGRTFTCGLGVAEVTAYTSTTQVTVEITTAFAATVMAGNTWLLEGSPLCILVPGDKDPVGASTNLVAAVSAFRTSDIGSYVQINGGLCKITSLGSIAADSDTYDGDGFTTTFDYTFQLLSPTELTVTVDGVPKAYLTDYELTNVGNPAGGRVNFITLAPPATAPGNVVISRAAGSPNTAGAVIVQELTSVTAAPEDAWVIKTDLWNAVDGYPSAVAFFQQRLYAANTAKYPQSFWGSRSGLFFDFTPGTDDDHAVYKTMDSRRANPIRYLHSDRTLVALTDPAEFDVRGGVEKPVTQTNASITKQSGWGCAAVKPEDVGDNVLFVQRGGKVIRALTPLEIDGFTARDISVFSEHLVQDGVAGITFQQTPESVAWAHLDSGDFVAISYSTEQNLIALAPGSTGTAGAPGHVESMCTVPEGSAEMTYAIVRRTIDGTTHRYMERFNWNVNPGMDSRAVGTGGPTTWGGFDHLEGEQITLLVDGIAAGTQTVVGGEVTTDADAVEVIGGLAYVPRGTLQDVEVGTGSGTAQGQTMSVHQVTVRVYETYGCTVGDEQLAFEQFGDGPLDGEAPLFTGDIQVSSHGWSNDGTAPLEISQPDPYPWTVLAVIRSMTVNAG